MASALASRVASAHNSGALLQDLSERAACGCEGIPDAVVSYHLRQVGCDVDESGLRHIAASATSLARRILAPVKESVDVEVAVGVVENVVDEVVEVDEGEGYWENGCFVATTACSVQHVMDFRGENWVVNFKKPTLTITGRRAKTIWYSCQKYGHDEAGRRAHRHYKEEVVEPQPKRQKSGKDIEAVDPVTPVEVEPEKPKKVLRTEHVLRALGAPKHVAASALPRQTLCGVR